MAAPTFLKQFKERLIKNYVVKHERLKAYLYTLGFDYKKDKDKTGKQDYIYLFPQSDKLLEAITFYTTFKNKLKK